MKKVKKETKMKNKKQDTWLPIFTGFYNSIFDEGERFIEYETELSEEEYKCHYENLYKAGIPQSYFNENLCDYIDDKAGYIGASEYICDGLLEMESADIIKDVTYQSLESPKYYNFSTDSINCEIEYDSEKLAEYLNENLKAFTEYIADRYTSRDGFRSSYSNDVEYWLDQDNWDSHEVGSLLQFVLELENSEPELDLYYASNCGEGFRNATEIDFDKMIQDFKNKKVG